MRFSTLAVTGVGLASLGFAGVLAGFHDGRKGDHLNSELVTFRGNHKQHNGTKQHIAVATTYTRSERTPWPIALTTHMSGGGDVTTSLAVKLVKNEAQDFDPAALCTSGGGWGAQGGECTFDKRATATSSTSTFLFIVPTATAGKALHIDTAGTGCDAKQMPDGQVQVPASCSQSSPSSTATSAMPTSTPRGCVCVETAVNGEIFPKPSCQCITSSFANITTSITTTETKWTTSGTLTSTILVSTSSTSQLGLSTEVPSTSSPASNPSVSKPSMSTPALSLPLSSTESITCCAITETSLYLVPSIPCTTSTYMVVVPIVSSAGSLSTLSFGILTLNSSTSQTDAFMTSQAWDLSMASTYMLPITPSLPYLMPSMVPSSMPSMTQTAPIVGSSSSMRAWWQPAPSNMPSFIPTVASSSNWTLTQTITSSRIQTITVSITKSRSTSSQTIASSSFNETPSSFDINPPSSSGSTVSSIVGMDSSTTQLLTSSMPSMPSHVLEPTTTITSTVVVASSKVSSSTPMAVPFSTSQAFVSGPMTTSSSTTMSQTLTDSMSASSCYVASLNMSGPCPISSTIINTAQPASSIVFLGGGIVKAPMGWPTLLSAMIMVYLTIQGELTIFRLTCLAVDAVYASSYGLMAFGVVFGAVRVIGS